MNPLQSRKQLLLAESELNRAQLVEDVADLTEGVRAFTDRAKSLGSIVSSTAALVADVAAFRRAKTANAGAKKSWLPAIIKGAGLVSSLWLAFRPPGRGQDET